MMKPEHSRAARAWLGWSQQDLAERAKVGLSTVKDFESGKREPIANNLSAMHAALSAGGVCMDFHKDGKPKGITIKS
jgi:ribosome-binding protein aMBF1 (putative translation factor)